MKAISGPGAFRFFLAVLVLASHTTKFRGGIAAVYVFFVLSGYWIAQMWVARYHRRYGVYLVSRAWRLIPVFVTCSLLSWWLAWHGVPAGLNWPREIFSSIAILGYNTLPFPPNVPAWSLDIEVQFYLVAPVLVYVLAAKRPLLAAAGIFLLWLAAFYTALSYTLLLYLPFFAVGCATSVWRLSWPRPIAFAMLAFVATAALAFSPLRNVVLWSPMPIFAYNAQFNIGFALLLIPFALYTTTQRRGRIDAILGDLSYIVYLVHYTVIGAFERPESAPFWQKVEGRSAALAVTILLSLLIWRVIDRPMNRLRDRWVSKQLAAPVFAAVPEGGAK